MKQIVLVLGMHRSGTSALAGICHLLGAAAPASMLAPAPDNPTGFWESEIIVKINEGTLKTLGGAWYDCLTLDTSKLDAATRHAVADHCASVLTREFGDAPLSVLKDPRLSLLLDLWRPAFTARNLSVAPLLALRHPSEAIASLRRRDRILGDLALALWLHYTLEAEYHTRAGPRAVLSYDRLLQDWHGSLARVTALLDIDWPVDFAAAAPAVGEFLRPQLRHHFASANLKMSGKPPLSGWITETYDALRNIEDGGGDTQLARLDRVREQFAGYRASAPRPGLVAIPD